MRLFIALRPPPEALDHLARAVDGLRTTRVDQWHVTLAFLGEVPDVEPLTAPLARVAAGCSPLVLQLRGGGTFPGVLYAGLAGGVDGLRGLARDVNTACRDAGVGLEDRPYLPHLTVARRHRGDASLLDGYEGPTWTAAELELVRSRVDARVEHEVLERHPLSG